MICWTVGIIRISGIPPEDSLTVTMDQDNSTFERLSVVNFTKHYIKNTWDNHLTLLSNN